MHDRPAAESRSFCGSTGAGRSRAETLLCWKRPWLPPHTVEFRPNRKQTLTSSSPLHQNLPGFQGQSGDTGEPGLPICGGNTKPGSA